MAAFGRSPWITELVLFALLVAGAARAGGPAQPPDGAAAGMVVRYLVPPFPLDLDGVGTDQVPIVSCWSTSHDDVAFVIQLWGNGGDPSRPPIFEVPGRTPARSFVVGGPMASVGHVTTAVGRILAEPRKKLSFECTAQLWDYTTPSTPQPITTLPLVATPAKKRGR